MQGVPSEALCISVFERNVLVCSLSRIFWDGANTNRIESTWRHVKAYLNPYNRKEELHLPPCPLHVRGKVQGRGCGPIHQIPSSCRYKGLEPTRPCNFNGDKGNMHQRHLSGGTTELIPCASLVGPTGVSKCVSYKDTFCALCSHLSRVSL